MLRLRGLFPWKCDIVLKDVNGMFSFDFAESESGRTTTSRPFDLSVLPKEVTLVSNVATVPMNTDPLLCANGQEKSCPDGKRVGY